MTKFRVVSLASSSEGNCFLVLAGEDRFLIDLGISYSSLMGKLRFLRIPSPPTSVLLSHEHSDHTSGIQSVSKKFPLILYANARTVKRLNALSNTQIEKRVFTTGEAFFIGKIKVKPFRIYHDAAEPVGFSITYGKYKIVYLLDSGRVDELHLMETADADLVIIDSNYDTFSLSNGNYPDSVKARIIRTGHLSNEIVGNVILNHPNPETEFWLGHLSKENNSPGIASLTVNYILKYGKTHKRKFRVLPRKATGPVWEPVEERQLEFILKGINISDELALLREGLDVEKMKIFDKNLIRSREIRERQIMEIPVGEGNAWRVKGSDEGYVVAKEIDFPGVEGIEIGGKLWTCDCGDFLWKSRHKGIPCKHIIRVLHHLTSPVF
ncbi:MAG: MBL fold metallo-hydrolase [Nitrospira sp.]|nr:MBL fold metallo-hydrolase [Nitrospira sp.]